MNNLHRELAPVSDAAWQEIGEEASRTLKRYLAARRVVDVPEPAGCGFSSVSTGHTTKLDGAADGIRVLRREVLPVIELRVPFTLSRQQIDDVERGSLDSDWQPVKDAARKIAFAEDQAVFDGLAAAGIKGISEESSNQKLPMPSAPEQYPAVIAKALNELREAGVNGPYAVVLGASAYTAVSGGNEDGYPLLRHIERLADGGVIWAPAVEGIYVLSTRGGDFELSIGQDFSIGYSAHTADSVELYLEETFTFRVLTTEASVVVTA